MASLDFREDFAAAIQSGLKSRTLNCCSRWAENRRIMGSPFAGPYSYGHHPWARAIHDSKAAYTVAMKAAQTGVTEVAINRAFYTLDKLKRDVLYVLPTSTGASDFSKARFAGALNLSPYLKALFTDTNTVGLKSTGTNVLYIRGSRGDSNLVSIPVSELILDELDRMKQDAVWLALERLSGQVEKHVVAVSTPTVPKYGIHKLFLDSTQEHFTFQCPGCGKWTELIWPDCVEIVGESVSDRRCFESYLKCKECGVRLPHETKLDWLAGGKWQETNDQASSDESRGFYVNQLYSATVSPGELVVAYHRGLGDEAANKEFHNSKLGLPFVGDGSKITDEMIDAALGNHSIHDLRPDIGGRSLITMGVDQGKTGFISVVDWNVNHTLIGDIQDASIGKLLWFGKFAEDDWDSLGNLMREWQVLAAVLDADPQVNEVRRFCRAYYGYAWATRYRKGQAAKEIALSEEESGAPFATVDRTSWLSSILSRFKTRPARLILPCDVSLEYRDHLKNTVRTYEKDAMGNQNTVFVNTGPDHYFHSLVYAAIGLSLASTSIGAEDIKK